MNFKEVIENRRSVRSFTEEVPTNDKLEEIVRLSSYSPSWKNSQTVRYHFIKEQQIKNEIATNATAGFTHNENIIKSAPIICIITSKKEISGYNSDKTFTTSKNEAWEMFDAGIASQTFCLSAFSLNIDTVILGIFDENKIKEIYSIPSDENVSAIIALGYRLNQEIKTPRRLSVSELMDIK